MSFKSTTRTDIYGGPAASGAFVWNKYLGAKWIDVFIIGSGGGASSGAVLVAASTQVPSNSGQGGAIAYYSFPAAMLGLTVNVVVGAGGAGGISGGAGVVVGGKGGDSSFGNLVVIGGQGPTLPNSVNFGQFHQNAASVNPARGLDGGGGGTVGSSASNVASTVAAGGGGGGGAANAGVPSVGIAGGAVGQNLISGRVVSLPGGTSGALGSAGGPGGSDAVGGVSVFGGSGGGGGGGSVIIAVPAGAGGAGGWPGGGGGGGGHAIAPATVAGNGGAGANAFIFVVTHF